MVCFCVHFMHHVRRPEMPLSAPRGLVGPFLSHNPKAGTCPRRAAPGHSKSPGGSSGFVVGSLSVSKVALDGYSIADKIISVKVDRAAAVV